ncbi:MAG: dTDP-4-dehydrorhamnose reductase [Nitrosopumilus sp.]|nr:dTDP-4-dehydrorhamnose reductase [Nitrosopumilus sp.]
MKFLVTGSAGLIGQNVVQELLKQNHEVYSCYHEDKPTTGIPISLDLTDSTEIKKIMEKIKPDTVIHLAAMTKVDLCETEKELAHTLNVTATEILAYEAAKISAFFVYVSTDYVFDGKDGMKKEDDAPNPLGYYGKTKLEGELSLNNLASNWAIARTSTPFGNHSKKKSFPLWINENLKSKNKIRLLTDQYTSPTYVPNLSKMIIEIAVRQINGIIHLAGASRISRYDFAVMIAERLGLDKTLLLKAKIEDMNWKAKRPKDSSLDVTKAIEILNEKPMEIQKSLPLFIEEITNQ